MESIFDTAVTEPTIEAISHINGLPSGLAVPYHVKKDWGYELWFNNTEQYCCKLLHIYQSHSCSLHFHVKKQETLVVTKGTLSLEYIKDKKYKLMRLPTGSAFVIAPGFVHRLTAENSDVELIEASTQHFDTDSVRIS